MKKKPFSGRELYEVFARSCSYRLEGDVWVWEPCLKWEELSEQGRKAWINVARTANGTKKR